MVAAELLAVVAADVMLLPPFQVRGYSMRGVIPEVKDDWCLTGRRCPWCLDLQPSAELPRPPTVVATSGYS